MKKMNNKGFTLVELIATIVLLALVMGIGAYSITAVIESSREKDYQLLIENINNAVEGYYQECKFVNNNCVSEITLGKLVQDGFLKGNSTDSEDKFIIVNPNDEQDISDCKIKYNYIDGKMVVENNGQNATNSCPTSY